MKNHIATVTAINKDNTLARKIVAELLVRERFAKHLLNKALLSESETLKLTRFSDWAEAHNAAETARRILYSWD